MVERLKKIEQLSFEAAKTVQQLLTFARKASVEQTPMMLVPFIKEVIKPHRISIPENISLSTEYGDDPLPVLGDITQLQQVFLNLLTNARDALKRADEPQIKVSLDVYNPDQRFLIRHPEASNQTAYARIKVSDNGCGIAKEHLGKVFDPFFTTKQTGEGTGLGLAMAYGAIQTHNGIIDVQSTPGKGSTFSIYLPLAADTKMVVSEPPLEMLEGKGETILIADDDCHILEIFREVLIPLNYHVITARNCQEAVELYRSHAEEIDLVILDIVMPRLGGPEAAKLIREIQPEINLIYATGYDSHVEAISKEHGSRVLNKPFDPKLLSRTLRELLDSPKRNP